MKLHDIPGSHKIVVTPEDVKLVTEQEKFWNDETWAAPYRQRNQLNYAQRVPYWRGILDLTQAQSILEVGTNTGANLKALRCANRQLDLKGVDVSYEACIEAVLAGLDVEQVRASDVGVKWPGKFTLSFTAGVLIHIPPHQLDEVLNSIIASSNRFVLAVEYESEHEEGIDYRGHSDRLWRRPYGRLYQEKGLKLVDVRDAGEGFDRCTSWLMTIP